MKKYIVMKSPWPDRLPNGTVVTSEDGVWFKREDGVPLFEKGQDKAYDKRGTFRLFSREIDQRSF